VRARKERMQTSTEISISCQRN